MNRLLQVGSVAVLAIGAIGGYLFYRGGVGNLFGDVDNTHEVSNKNKNKNGKAFEEQQKMKPMDLAGSKRIPENSPLINQAFQNGR